MTITSKGNLNISHSSSDLDISKADYDKDVLLEVSSFDVTLQIYLNHDEILEVINFLNKQLK